MEKSCCARLNRELSSQAWPRTKGEITALAFDPSGDRLYSAGSEPMLAAWGPG